MKSSRDLLHNRRDKANNETGQSLVEFILLVPIFFIGLSGINLYLNQKIKSLTEDSAYESLLISDSNFDDEERVQAQWNGANIKTKQYNEDILKHAFNASSYFNNSVELKDGVFLDKKKVIQDTENVCKNLPAYRLDESKPGKLKFSSCANGSGFESAQFSYQGIMENFKSTLKRYDDQTIFYPENDLIWSKRHLIPTNSIRLFSLTPLGQSFNDLYSSLRVPRDQSRFNAQCFMDPITPNCPIPPLAGKWRRAVYDGANIQVLECFAEMSGKCLLTSPTPPVLAACIAKGIIQIENATSNGTKAPVCPILNNTTAIIYKEVLVTSKFYSAKTFSQELLQRGSAMAGNDL